MKYNNMVTDNSANIATATGIFAYLAQFQVEITLIMVLTAITLNVIRIVDYFIKKKIDKE